MSSHRTWVARAGKIRFGVWLKLCVPLSCRISLNTAVAIASDAPHIANLFRFAAPFYRARNPVSLLAQSRETDEHSRMRTEDSSAYRSGNIQDCVLLAPLQHGDAWLSTPAVAISCRPKRYINPCLSCQALIRVKFVC